MHILLLIIVSVVLQKRLGCLIWVSRKFLITAAIQTRPAMSVRVEPKNTDGLFG